ncbi:MAG TPA: nicotinate (nicotinamide) nucleotide adenylyltransferase [Holophagaceae bacterium]|nr:nicotinate (nicotinamide) nucleotide adenylyltransferase [Holophagaceae bacterium]
MRRVGLLGGAFNPPHQAHLQLARLALGHLGLDELRFMPSALSPHKPTPGDITDAQRLALLEAAIAGLDPRARVESLELERGGTSYTADTLETLSAREPEAAWILVLGSDQLPGLPRWRRAETVFRLASLAVAERPGQAAAMPPGLPLKPVARWSGAAGELVSLPSTELDLASTALREELRQGGAVPGLPAPVARLIQSENLYR